MKTKQAVAVAALLITLAPSVAYAQSGTCYDNLSDISYAEISLASKRGETSQVREYVLCPHREYRIGTPMDDGITYENGSLPLVILNPNVRILCGRDGSSSNNCVLSGGDHQLVASSASSLPISLAGVHPDASNLVLKGLTFQGAKDVTMGFQSRGSHILVEDCVFRDSIEGDFVVYVDLPEDLEGEEQEEALSTTMMSGRPIENSNIFVPSSGGEGDDSLGVVPEEGLVPAQLDVTIRKCRFENNIKELAIVGSIGGAVVVVEQSTFHKNQINQLAEDVGSILWFTNGSGDVFHNCFTDNSYNLATLLVNGGNFFVDMNYANDEPRGQQTVGCDNYLKIEKDDSLGNALQAKSYQCIDFQGESCEQSLEVKATNSAADGRVVVSAMSIFLSVLSIVVLLA